MKLVFSDSSTGGTLVRLVTKEQAAKASGATDKEFSGAVCSVFITRENGRRVALAGVGPEAKVSANSVRRTCATIARKIAGFGETQIAVEAGSHAAHASAIAEGIVMGSYTFERFKTESRRDSNVEELAILDLDESQQKAAIEGLSIGEAVNTARELGNTPPNLLPPAIFAEEARKIAEAHQAKVRVWNEESLVAEGFGGLMAVGGGSTRKPRFVVIERHVDDSYPTIAVVGKSITFDTGGISIKPAAGMEEMKFDMMGGAASLGIFTAVCALNLPINLVVALCSAENMPGGGAYRPGDIITNYGGKTIEVLNTDAEGRVVLSDGLSYVRKHFPNTDLIIDLATLTGACVVAVGLDRTGAFTTDEKLASTFKAAGDESGDLCWPLPLGDEYSEEIKSRVADVANLGANRWGGASKAAAFLQYFVGEARWVHLDIAGPANLPGDKPEMEKGAAGAGVRLVIEALRRLYGDKK